MKWGILAPIIFVVAYILYGIYQYYQTCDADCRARNKQAQEERKAEREAKRAEWRAKPFGEKAKIIATNVAIGMLYLIGIVLFALVFGAFSGGITLSSGY